MASRVYLARITLQQGPQAVSEKARTLFRTAGMARCFKPNDFTAVKIHVGEHGNTTHIKADCLRGLIEELRALKTKPFLTDTSTLYSGRRHNAVDHTILAAEHGFSLENLGIPFIAPDGLFGTSETAVRIDCPLNKEVLVAYDIVRCQSILSCAHFTGHVAACAGATLKTIGMGCTSRKAKMRQHASLKPQVGDNCTLCGQCRRYCPADAITLDEVKAHIDRDKCIGCAECVAVCRFDAVKYDWGAENPVLQKNVAEHALGVLKDKAGRACFFNFLLSITKDCDCFDNPDMPGIVPDIGIAASTDPVALDKASIDLVEQAGGDRLGVLIGNKKLDYDAQIGHAEAIGLGTASYELVDV